MFLLKWVHFLHTDLETSYLNWSCLYIWGIKYDILFNCFLCMIKIQRLTDWNHALSKLKLFKTVVTFLLSTWYEVWSWHWDLMTLSHWISFLNLLREIDRIIDTGCCWIQCIEKLWGHLLATHDGVVITRRRLANSYYVIFRWVSIPFCHNITLVWVDRT